MKLQFNFTIHYLVTKYILYLKRNLSYNLIYIHQFDYL
jgi:hypothetical protein